MSEEEVQQLKEEIEEVKERHGKTGEERVAGIQDLLEGNEDIEQARIDVEHDIAREIGTIRETQQENLQNLKDLADHLREQLVQARKEFDDDLDRWQKAKDDAVAEQQKLQQQLEEAQGKLAEAENENNELEKEVKDTEDMIETLKNEFGPTPIELLELEAELAAVQQHMQQEAEFKVDLQEMEKDANTRFEKYADAIGTTAEGNLDIDNLDQQELDARLEKEKLALQQQLEEKETALQSAKADHKILQDRTAKLTALLHKLQDNLLVEEVLKLRQQLTEAADEASPAASSDSTSIAQEIKFLLQTIATKAQQQQDQVQQQQEFEQLRQQLAAAQKQLQSAEQEHSEKTSALEKQLQQLTAEHNNSRKNNSGHDNALAELTKRAENAEAELEEVQRLLALERTSSRNPISSSPAAASSSVPSEDTPLVNRAPSNFCFLL